MKLHRRQLAGGIRHQLTKHLLDLKGLEDKSTLQQLQQAAHCFLLVRQTPCRIEGDTTQACGQPTCSCRTSAARRRASAVTVLLGQPQQTIYRPATYLVSRFHTSRGSSSLKLKALSSLSPGFFTRHADSAKYTLALGSRSGGFLAVPGNFRSPTVVLGSSLWALLFAFAFAFALTLALGFSVFSGVTRPFLSRTSWPESCSPACSRSFAA